MIVGALLGRLTLLASSLSTPVPRAVCLCTAPVHSLLQPWFEQTLTAERRKRTALKKEEDAARKAEGLGAWATLVVANLYRIDASAESVTVEDWAQGGAPTELRFAPGAGTPQEQADAAFKKARKLRRGSAVVATLLQESEAAELKLEAWRAEAAMLAEAAPLAATEETDDAMRRLTQRLLKEAKRRKWKAEGLGGQEAAASSALPRGRRADTQALPLAPSQTPGWEGREFESPSGVPILVGRNRRQNEQLSLKVAREPDVWMHARGCPGAHVLLQMSRVRGAAARAAPSDECLQMAADLAAFYSEARDERKALVTFAAPRHVTKPSGAPLGAVKLREEGGSIVANPNSERVPLPIREARDKERFGKS